MKNKKIIATVVALASFLAMATSGLAAATVSTTAKYSGENLAVTVNVTGGASTDQVTYLVKSAKASDSVSNNSENIVYINQVAGDEGKFNFVVNKEYVGDGVLSVTSNMITDTDVVVAENTTKTCTVLSTTQNNANTVLTYIKVTGTYSEFGVEYKGVKCPAVKADGGKATGVGIYAVELVGDDAINKDDVKVYIAK